MYFTDFEKELLDNSHDYYYFCGLDSYEIKHMNKPLCDFLSLNVNDIIGKKCYEVIYGLKKPCGWCLNVELGFDSLKIASIETQYNLGNETFFCSIFSIIDYENNEDIHVTRYLPNKSLDECFTSNMT